MSRTSIRCALLLYAASLILPMHAAKAQTGAHPRDRLVTAPGNQFDKAPYWNAMMQCAVAYALMFTYHTLTALEAKLKLEEKLESDKGRFEAAENAANEMRAHAAGFYGAAERFLMADRQVTLQEARVIKDRRAAEIKGVIRMVGQATPQMKPCADLHQVCAKQFAEICSGKSTGKR